MKINQPIQNNLRRVAVFVAALALLSIANTPAAAQGSGKAPITSEGFDKLVAESTLYMSIPLKGVMAVDCPADAVNAALQAAADNEQIKHAVFMIDSEEGWPLENDDIGGFKGDLEITAVVRQAMAPAIFPAFFADQIFMTETALIGGLPLHAFTARGSTEVTAKQVGILSSMLASAAQSRGHDPAIAYAMIDQKKQLYAWKEDGKTRLSNIKPDNPGSKTNFRTVRKALPSSVLVIDQKTAIEIGFAKPIDAFDDQIVGGYPGRSNWTAANQFGRIANGIGMVIDELEPLRKEIRELDKSLIDIKNNRENQRRYSESEVRGYKQFKNNLDEAVRDLDIITSMLAKVYEMHPERHTYFRGPNGETIVADPAQWTKDVSRCEAQLNQARTKLLSFTKDFRTLGGDAEYLYNVNRNMEKVMEHLRGIKKHGNARYWDEFAKPDLPDDVYG